MSLQSAPDIPLRVTSATTTSERRVNPSWTISYFKSRLEPITGIPAGSQRLLLRAPAPSSQHLVIEAADENSVQLGQWGLSAYGEITVQDTRPAHLQRAENLTDPAASDVPKYEMPQAEYEALPSTVRAYKRAHGLGRFAPDTPAAASAVRDREHEQVAARGLAVGARCRLLPAAADARRGSVAYVGPVPEIPDGAAGGAQRTWVGVALDEPTGKNDGSIGGAGGTRYFACQGSNFGVFVRPERVEVGDFAVEDDELGSDMEEI